MQNGCVIGGSDAVMTIDGARNGSCTQSGPVDVSMLVWSVLHFDDEFTRPQQRPVPTKARHHLAEPWSARRLQSHGGATRSRSC